MANKSPLRTKIEKVMIDMGLAYMLNSSAVYTDKSKSGWRIKYCFHHLTPMQTSELRHNLHNSFPNNDVRIVDVKDNDAIGMRYYHGTAIKVYN